MPCGRKVAINISKAGVGAPIVSSTTETLPAQKLTFTETIEHIFPENMRGTGEGHRDWDLRPESKMTNANVAEIKNMGDGRVMTVQYKGGEKQVLITPRTSVVSYEPASRSDLKPGTGVFINNAERQPDGTYTAPRSTSGRPTCQKMRTAPWVTLSRSIWVSRIGISVRRADHDLPPS